MPRLVDYQTEDLQYIYQFLNTWIISMIFGYIVRDSLRLLKNSLL